MAKSPKKNIPPKVARANKAPGKTILPRSKFKQQRRFSLIDSDSSSSLSEFESEDDEELPKHRSNTKSHQYRNQFQAIQSESEEEDEEEDDDDNDSSTNEEIWKNNSKRVVNTSSEDEESDDDSSSSDDEDVDFVKLTAERKAKSLEAYRSVSPFKSPSPGVKKGKDEDVNFTFDWNKNSHELNIDQEEEDVGEELSGIISPLKKDIPISGQPLGLVNIEDSNSDDDIDKEELLRTLEQDSDGIDTGIDTGEDDYNLLQEEADNILQDYDTGMLQLSSNTTPRNSIVEDMIRKHKEEMKPENDEEALQFVSEDDYDDDYDEYDDNDEDDEFLIPFFDDTSYKERLLYTSEGAINSLPSKKKELDDSEDDSYLWDYFFSSGDEGDGHGNSNYENNSDDEATDEDTTLPPPSSRKKIGSKAQELLSSSSVIARPPALGTWSTDSKPFGIIDGLSTRSLIPTPTKNNGGVSNSNNSTPITTSGNAPSTPINTNGAEEFTLDELLNMSELEDDENEASQMNPEEWLEVTSYNRKVPLSAFRNKGIINEGLHVNATRRFSNPGSGSKRNSKKNKKINEITMTPVRVISKQQNHKRRNSKLKRRQSSAEAVEGLRATRSGLFSEDTLTNVEEFLSGLGNEAELSLLFREVQ